MNYLSVVFLLDNVVLIELNNRINLGIFLFKMLYKKIMCKYFIKNIINRSKIYVNFIVLYVLYLIMIIGLSVNFW